MLTNEKCTLQGLKSIYMLTNEKCTLQDFKDGTKLNRSHLTDGSKPILSNFLQWSSCDSWAFNKCLLLNINLIIRI